MWNPQVWANNSVSVYKLKAEHSCCLYRPTFLTMGRLSYRAGLTYSFCLTLVDTKREMKCPQYIWKPECFISITLWLFFFLTPQRAKGDRIGTTLAATSTRSVSKLSWQRMSRRSLVKCPALTWILKSVWHHLTFYKRISLLFQLLSHLTSTTVLCRTDAYINRKKFKGKKTPEPLLK